METLLDLLRQFWIDLQSGQLPPLGYWNYLLLMVLIILQGPIATMLGGAAASAGLLNPFAVLGVAMVGNLSGDAFWYGVGYSGRTGRLERFLQRYRQYVRALQAEMNEHAVRILLLAKLSYGMAVPAVLAAGFARVPLRRFAIVVPGEFIWTTTFLLIGYYATEAIKGAQQVVIYLGIAVPLLFVLLLFFWLPRKLRPHIEAHEEEENRRE